MRKTLIALGAAVMLAGCATATHVSPIPVKARARHAIVHASVPAPAPAPAPSVSKPAQPTDRVLTSPPVADSPPAKAEQKKSKTRALIDALKRENEKLKNELNGLLKK